MVATPGGWTINRARRFVVAALLSTAACGCSEQQSADAPLARITVGTGPAGTLYNQIGTALTTLAQRELGIASTARPYTGSSIYLPQMHRGELPFGLNNAADTRAAYRGELVYARPLRNLRVAMLLSRAPYGYYVKAGSGIRELEQLRAEPIVTSFRSIAPFDRINEAVLATAGLRLVDVRGVSVAGVPDSVRALVEGRAIAASSVLGIPTLREAHATVPDGLRVLPLGSNEQAVTAMEGFSVLTLQPGPAMVGITEPTRVAHMDVYLNTSSVVPDEDVYRIVRTFHLSWAELQKTLPAFRSVAAAEHAPLNIGHPFHQGAIRYFREAGLWTEAHERLQQGLLK